ncbi:alpha/beta hydrolase [Leptospira langatensis]|uniref:Alpha/beta hydrolase n=1 Tax=Leptospira langatensis TaxID=2484983 RepID=A0A5F1ZY60_9LEPT|nr:alpha/beta hydrolase [Leptospira langatensis]TGJ98276.1 alpha/beta hydrolase [Leptospira langatensis]TGL43190.1 alpha/beta hydrolase [Leptospira langatensis]
MLGYVVQGFPFLLKYADMISSPPSEVLEEEVSLTGFPKFRLKIFPAAPNSPSVYLQHGMSARGIDDPRILTLATHLRNSGLQVFLPELPEVKGLRIASETVGNIRALFDFFSKREGRSISFLSASFSAGMGMVALAGKKQQEFLDSVLLVGTYSDFSQTLPFILSNYDLDPYAVHIVLYNYISKIRPELKSLEEFYYQTALDNGLQRTGPSEKGPEVFQTLGKAEKEFAASIRSDASFRESLASSILKVLPKDFIRENSPCNFLEDWKAPISLLHGFDDPVISPTESESLYEALGRRSYIDSIFLKSRLITHGDHLPFYTQLGEIPKLAAVWGFFLKKTGL